MMMKKIIVLDTSAFISGFDPFSLNEPPYSVPAVLDELVPNSLPWVRFQTAVANKKLIVKTPTSFFLDQVRRVSAKVGDVQHLSSADMHVLALALELKSNNFYPSVVTDDYSIQNVANKIGIHFASIITLGIRFRFNWIIYCPACFRKYPSDHKSKCCRVCGTELKRKPQKRIPLRNHKPSP
jgi:UPF0271 protein